MKTEAIKTPTPEDLLILVPPLETGSHRQGEPSMCVMEAVAFVAGEPHSDSPDCCSPSIAGLLRIWNDSLPPGWQDKLLRPLILKLIGTNQGEEAENARRRIFLDWLRRIYLPLWLHAGGWEEQAELLSREVSESWQKEFRKIWVWSGDRKTEIVQALSSREKEQVLDKAMDLLAPTPWAWAMIGVPPGVGVFARGSLERDSMELVWRLVQRVIWLVAAEGVDLAPHALLAEQATLALVEKLIKGEEG